LHWCLQQHSCQTRSPLYLKPLGVLSLDFLCKFFRLGQQTIILLQASKTEGSSWKAVDECDEALASSIDKTMHGISEIKTRSRAGA